MSRITRALERFRNLFRRKKISEQPRQSLAERAGGLIQLKVNKILDRNFSREPVQAGKVDLKYSSHAEKKVSKEENRAALEAAVLDSIDRLQTEILFAPVNAKLMPEINELAENEEFHNNLEKIKPFLVKNIVRFAEKGYLDAPRVTFGRLSPKVMAITTVKNGKPLHIMFNMQSKKVYIENE